MHCIRHNTFYYIWLHQMFHSALIHYAERFLSKLIWFNKIADQFNHNTNLISFCYLEKCRCLWVCGYIDTDTGLFTVIKVEVNVSERKNFQLLNGWWQVSLFKNENTYWMNKFCTKTRMIDGLGVFTIKPKMKWNTL